MTTIHNPVLRGFHPDPSICRVEDVFYIAVSTFEWFPGVLIYRSRNLHDWKLVGRALDRLSQLNMAGTPASGGIWAPCLSYADGKFWLIYTDVKNWAGTPPAYNDNCKDVHNYLVTADQVEGPWSDPVYMNSSGFDPSLFHDDDGRTWFVNQLWDYRPGKNSFAGIVLQEYSKQQHKLIGCRTNIFRGSSLGVTEAPHLYKRRGYYYLMTAEGGTSYRHAVTLARSRNIEGPYELHPQTPLLTSVRDREAVQTEDMHGDVSRFLCDGLQKAGHGSMAPLTDDEWVLAHLCGRPLPGTLRCPLGRETALQRLLWRSDDWPWPDGQNPETNAVFAAVDFAPAQPTGVWREDFDSNTWALELQTLRLPADYRFDMDSVPGWIGLSGAESFTSTFRQTLLARRVQHFAWRAETRMMFEPEDFQQMAGLVVRYNESTQYILRLHREDDGNKTLGLVVYDRGVLSLPLGDNEAVIDTETVRLGVRMDGSRLQFRWSVDAAEWNSIGPELDSSKLSDEYALPMGFTGMFVGIGCFDVSGRSAVAYFDYLEYIHTDDQ